MHKVIDNKAFFKTVADSLNQKESVSFLVKGRSMNPFFIDQETEVFIEKKDQYRVLDVCLFEINGQFILHRLIKIRNHQYFFRGDHLYRFEIADASHILGSVYQFKHRNKYVKTKRCSYIFKVKTYLFYKQIKMLIRTIYRGIRYGRQAKH